MHEILLQGGLTDFTPVRGSWTKLPDLPYALSEHVMGIDDQGVAWMCSGQPRNNTNNRLISLDLNKRLYKLHPNTTNTPPAVNLAGGAVLGRVFYFCGGYDGANPQRLMRGFNLDTGVWSNLKDMPSTRYGHKVIASNRGTLLIIGGRVSASVNTNVILEYNPQTNDYSPLPFTLPVSDWGMKAAMMGNELVVSGGMMAGTRPSTVLAWDLDTNIRRSLPNQLPLRGRHSIDFIDGALVTFGGNPGTYGADHLPDQATSWSALTVTPDPANGVPVNRYTHETAVWGHSVVITGGFTTQVLNDAWLLTL